MAGTTACAPICGAATAGADLADLVGIAAIDDGVSPDETAARHEYILDRLAGDATSAKSREFASAYRAAADRMLAEHRYGVAPPRDAQGGSYGGRHL